MNAFKAWFVNTVYFDDRGYQVANHVLLDSVEAIVRLDEPLRTGRTDSVRVSDLWARMAASQTVMLDVADVLVGRGGSSAAMHLRRIFEDVGSAYTVIQGVDGFEIARRVDPSMADAFEAALSPDDRAAHHLRDAWAKAFGRHPDPDASYQESIKAIEAVGIPVVCPTASSPTLGKVLAHMRDGSANFVTALDPQDGGGVGRVVGMMELIWQTAHNRHGEPGVGEPARVSQVQAEAAAFLAVTLVQWFRSGAIARR